MGEVWFRPGMRVRYTGKPGNGIVEKVYPETGTVGTVLDVNEWGNALVQWPEGSTGNQGRWWTAMADLKPI